MSDDRAIVVGGGANGLVAALTLRRAGHRVTLLERRATLGGLAGAEAFHPGFRTPGPQHDDGGWRFDLTREVTPPGVPRPRARRADVIAVGAAGPRRLAGNPAHDGDAGRRALAAFVETVRPAVERIAGRRPPDAVLMEANRVRDLLAVGVAVRGLGAATMMELLRVPPLPVADWLAEWIADPVVAAALALPAAAATFAGPRSPGTASVALLDAVLAGPGVEGGSTALVDALVEAARDAHVELRTGADVVAVEVERGAAAGVRLADGERCAGSRVLVTTHPRSLIELLPAGALHARTVTALRALRSRGTVAHLALALDRPFEIDGERTERVRLASDVDEIERAFDDAKHGRLPADPVLDVHVASATRPDLAPPGAEVLSILIGFVPPPGRLEWDAGARDALVARVEARLARHAPGFSRTIVGRRLRTPADLETEYALPGGCLRHVEHSLDQLLVRPVPHLAGWLTPVAGLAVGGGGCHPGGGLTGAPGRLAADALANQSAAR